MQHAWKHVERPGGSHTALDGKKRGATWHWCDLTFIEPSVVKLDYGKVSASYLSSLKIALCYLELQEMI